MAIQSGLWVASLVAIIGTAQVTALAGEAPKFGGILTYAIPADAPPSFDAHREGTFATVHSAAPLLQRVDPGRSRQPVFNDRLRLRSVHGTASGVRQWEDLHFQDPRGRQVS